MSVPVSLTSTTGAASTSSNPLSSAQLNMTDFMNLLTVQLENQDPLNPMSDSDFFAQMAQLGQVEGMDNLNNAAQVQQAQSLMGQTVTAVDSQSTSAGNTTGLVTGTVTSLSIQNGNYLIGLQQTDGSTVQVPLNAIQSIQGASGLGPASSYIGQNITASVPNGSSTAVVTGLVTSVSSSSGVPTLQVQQKNGITVGVPVSEVTSVN